MRYQTQTQYFNAMAYIESAEVRLLLAGENFERGRLTDAVRPDQTKHLARSWCRQSAEHISHTNILLMRAEWKSAG